MRRRSATLLSMCLALGLSVTPAAADTLAVTGGNLDIAHSLSGGYLGRIDISGDRGFTLIADVSSSGGVFQPGSCLQGAPCLPGSTLDIGAGWVGLDLRNASATLDGTSYTLGGQVPPSASAGVEFSGTAALPETLTPSAIITAPFSLSGTFSFQDNGSGFLHDLFGRGTATIFLERLTIPGLGTGWGVSHVRYDLSSSPGEPIPEPATLLLLGAGLGSGLLMRRARHAQG